MNAERALFDGLVSEAVLPARGGELTIMDDHEQIFVALRKGNIRLKSLSQKGFFSRGRFSDKNTSEDIKPIRINGGLARMKRNELIVLVE